MSSKERKLYDVVIYEIATKKIDSIAGTNLPESGGFHTVAKRIETVWPRLDDDYSVRAVEAGKYAKGDVLP